MFVNYSICHSPLDLDLISSEASFFEAIHKIAADAYGQAMDGQFKLGIADDLDFCDRNQCIELLGSHFSALVSNLSVDSNCVSVEIRNELYDDGGVVDDVLYLAEHLFEHFCSCPVFFVFYSSFYKCSSKAAHWIGKRSSGGIQIKLLDRAEAN